MDRDKIDKTTERYLREMRCKTPEVLDMMEKLKSSELFWYSKPRMIFAYLAIQHNLGPAEMIRQVNEIIGVLPSYGIKVYGFREERNACMGFTLRRRNHKYILNLYLFVSGDRLREGKEWSEKTKRIKKEKGIAWLGDVCAMEDKSEVEDDRGGNKRSP